MIPPWGDFFKQYFLCKHINTSKIEIQSKYNKKIIRKCNNCGRIIKIYKGIFDE